jgi:hypothetical protein
MKGQFENTDSVISDIGLDIGGAGYGAGIKFIGWVINKTDKYKVSFSIMENSTIKSEEEK